MKGGTRKRGSTWSYYFDLGTINGKRQKEVSKQKRKRKRHLQKRSMNTIMQDSYLNIPKSRCRTILINGMICTASRT